MCRLAFTTAECCLVFDRPTGAKLIGFFYTTLFFFGLLGPIVELNRYRTERNANYLSGGGNFTISNHENVFSVLEEYGHMTSAGYEVCAVARAVKRLPWKRGVEGFMPRQCYVANVNPN